MQQQPQRPRNRAYRSRYNKRRQRRKRLAGLLVIVVALVVILVISLLLGGGKQKAPSSEVQPPASQTESLPDASSEAMVSSVAESVAESVVESKPEPQPPGPYDEEGIPPLYNATHSIPEEATAALLAEGGMIAVGGERMEARAGQAFLDMRAAAAADGIDLAPVSGYRSNQRQTTNFNNAIDRNMGKGMSREEAEIETRRYYAVPGTSEHEAGLAMDIGWIEESFEGSPAFGWLQQHCNEYGFIFRYRKETESITGIAYEPWHYRYVGANHAKAIEAAGVTLEEYVEGLQK